MPDNKNINDNFDWEELLSSRTSSPAEKKEKPEPEEKSAVKEQEKTEDSTRRVKKPEPKPEPVFEEEEEELFDRESERDYLPIKTRRDGRVGLLGGMMYAVFVISVSVILACMAWLFASDVLALNKPEISATITLPKTIFSDKKVDELDEDGKVVGTKTIQVADIDYVAKQLKGAGIIEYEFLFKAFSAISDADEKLDPGTYELSTIFDYRALVKKMTAGSPSQVTTKLTFPEGYTMEQIFSLLEENDICSKEELYETAANSKFSYTFIDDEKLGDPKRLEGFLFPDTYEFYEGERPYSVISKFLYNFYYRFTAEMIDKAERKGLTVSQLVSVASLIEKEAGNDEDRYNISSVIYNRIGRGMPLQIDAAIQYILPERVPVLLDEHLQIDSPYNTYMYPGLTPTPIANPGMASIKAALDPKSTSYLFYALDTATGSHRFFTNSYEHAAFVATQDYTNQGG